MMINLWVVRFEDHEVKAGWKKVQEVSKKILDAAEPVALSTADFTLKQAVNGGRLAIEAAGTAVDAIQGVRDKVKLRKLRSNIVTALTKGVK